VFIVRPAKEDLRITEIVYRPEDSNHQSSGNVQRHLCPTIRPDFPSSW
jgi:hypothetical protein